MNTKDYILLNMTQSTIYCYDTQTKTMKIKKWIEL